MYRQRLLTAGLLSLAVVASAETVLTLPQFEKDDAEASAIERAGRGALVPSHWEESYWVAMDEPRMEEAMLLVGRVGTAWEIRPVPVSVQGGKPKKTTDCEALARRGDFVYVFGSRFGKKAGPLGKDRQFTARFRDPLAGGAEPVEGALSVELVRDDFLLHRAINDALSASSLRLIPRRLGEETAYIQASREESENVRAEDRAINVEGAVFLEDGTLLLGLRYPVTEEGTAILLTIDRIDNLFSGELPVVRDVYTLDLSAEDAPGGPWGVRALERRGAEVHAIIGNLDRRSGKGDGIVLDDHPTGGDADTRHVAFEMPAEGGGIRARLVSIMTRGSVEGLTFGADGRAVYAHDEKNVRLSFGE